MAQAVGFTFPRELPRARAAEMLAQAYAGIDEGKILRRTNALLRKRAIDPPMDVQYVAQPEVRRFRDGLGIVLGGDILIYHAFPEMEDCVAAFEDALSELLAGRLEKSVRAWQKARGRAEPQPDPKPREDG